MKTHGIKWLGLSVVVLAGFLMVAPSAFAAGDGGYSATCKDGTSWTGAGKRGACRGHKGVKSWTSDGGSSASTESGSKATHERKSRRSKKSEETATPAAAMNENASAESSHSRKSRRSKKTEAAAPAANATPTTTPAAVGAVSAMCKDGTSWSGKSKRGACRGHKGVKNWGDETAAATGPAAAPANHAPAGPMPVSRRTSTRTASTGGSMGSPAPGGGAGRVWVNTESKTYHCQGTKWYGTTKHGEYMTESQARSQGFHADHGKACTG